jgi:hypothetical protein
VSCGLFDVVCHIGNAWEGVLAWALSWLSLNFLVGLFLGSVLGARFGWLAPIAIALAVLARLAPKGTGQIQRDDPVFTERGDAEPSPKPRERRPIFPRFRKWFNGE